MHGVTWLERMAFIHADLSIVTYKPEMTCFKIGKYQDALSSDNLLIVDWLELLLLEAT